MRTSIERRRPSCISIATTCLTIGLLSGCSSSRREIRIPDSVVTDPSRPSARDRSIAMPYVVKMSDGRRTWQIEIPVSTASPSFQAAVPLDLGELNAQGAQPPPTEADRELLASKKARGESAPPVTSAPGMAPVAPNQSYFSTLARVRALYKRRQFELALIELVNLERIYPDDERILEMKGTLYSKLGRRGDAQKAWERVLALNPSNTMVARALEQLLEN